MTANEKLSDLQLKNQHDVEEFKNYVSSTLLLFLRRLEKRISKEITLFYDEEALTVANKVALKRKIRAIEETELNKIKDSLFKETEKFLGVQSDTYKSQLEKVFEDYSDYISINSVDPAKLKKEFEKSKINLDGGKIYSVATFWKIFSEAVTLRTAMNIESAYTANKPVKQFQDDVKTGYKIGENQLDATTKTLIQQAFTVAVISLNMANNKLIDGYVYSAILDERTSDICRSFNGLTYFYSYPEKSTLPYQAVPPLHFRCRSDIFPITKSYSELGIDPSELSSADKEYLSGKIPEKQTYYQWFSKQSAQTQKQILGATRYNAYANGSIKIDGFYNNGKKLTLTDLRKRGVEI